MRGLALEGGGARGSYHMGVVKAYIENGYEFDGFVGTSIGAINAAVLAQGDFEKALELWGKVSMDQLFDSEESHLMTLGDAKIDLNLPSNLSKGLKKIISGKGVDTTKMKAFLEEYIDEDKIRQSKKDFGLVTVSLDERKPYEIFLEDIPEGKLINYIMASATVPGFRTEVIGDKKFLDGGLYNNCPINLLVDKGYDEIIAIRTGAPGIFRKVDENANVRIISTDEDLGDLLLFSPEKSEANIKLGYYDGLRVIKNLQGSLYYLNGLDKEDVCGQLITLNEKCILKLGKMLEVTDLPPQRMLFEQIIPQLADFLNLKKDYNYHDFLIAMLEYLAIQREIDRFEIYDIKELYSLIRRAVTVKKEDNLLEKLFQKKKEEAVEYFIEIFFRQTLKNRY